MWRRTDVFADHPTIFQGVRASVIPAVAEPAAGCEAARGQRAINPVPCPATLGQRRLNDLFVGFWLA